MTKVHKVMLRELIGDEERSFCNSDGSQIYERVRARDESQLRRIGATTNCIVCGLPASPGLLNFAHIDMRDLHLSPLRDETRVFCLCWNHHHGCYDQGYISTMELLEAELVWIANKHRPRPHPRDLALAERHRTMPRRCEWKSPKVERRATFQPVSPLLLKMGAGIASMRSNAGYAH